MDRTPTSIRISADGRRLLAQLAKRLGITKAAVMELAIRSFATSQGIRDGRPTNTDEPAHERESE